MVQILHHRQEAICKRGGVSSYLIYIPSSVSQGVHLSPLMFSLFINTLSRHLSKFLLFGDDIKLFLKVGCTADQAVQQSGLNLFSIWVDCLELVLNLDKCHSITVTKSCSPLNRTYSINGLPLTQVSQIEYLSIFYKSSLLFNQY